MGIGNVKASKMKTINSDAFKKTIQYYFSKAPMSRFSEYSQGVADAYDNVMLIIDHMPDATIKGKWEGNRCSICGVERAWYGSNPAYCPDCGSYNGVDEDE